MLTREVLAHKSRKHRAVKTRNNPWWTNLGLLYLKKKFSLRNFNFFLKWLLTYNIVQCYVGDDLYIIFVPVGDLF